MYRFVPIITMKFGGIEVDLSYAPIARYQSRLPNVPSILLHINLQDFDILDDDNLLDVDEQTVRSLNGRRVTDTIINLTKGNQAVQVHFFCYQQEFNTALRAFRFWAKVFTYFHNIGFGHSCRSDVYIRM